MGRSTPDKYEKRAARAMRKTVGEYLKGVGIHLEAQAIGLEVIVTRDSLYLKPKERAALMTAYKLMLKAKSYIIIISNRLES